MTQIVAHGQTDEGATGARVGVRSPLTGQVREKEQSLAPGRHLRGAGDQFLEAPVGGKCVPGPSQAPRRREHHTHHVPSSRDGVAEGVDPPTGLHRRTFRGGEDHPRRPQRERHDSGSDRTDTDGIGRLIASPRHHRRPLAKACRPGRLLAEGPGHFRALVRRGEQRGVEIEGVEHLRGPGASGEIEEDRPRPVGHIDGKPTGEPEPQVVLGEQHVANSLPARRLVIAYPEQLGSREAGEGVVAGDLDETLRPDPASDLLALGLGPLVVPEDGGADDVTRLVEQHRAVHLTGEPDSLDPVGPSPGLLHETTDRLLRSDPPQAGVLLRPHRMRGVEPVLGRGHPADCAVGVDQDRLGGGRRGVDPDHQAQDLTPSVTRSSAVSSPSHLSTAHDSSWPTFSPGPSRVSGPRLSSSQKTSFT